MTAPATTCRWPHSARPIDPDYWGALEDLGYGRVGLLLPTKPENESLRLLDEYAAAVEKYRA